VLITAFFFSLREKRKTLAKKKREWRLPMATAYATENALSVFLSSDGKMFYIFPRERTECFTFRSCYGISGAKS